MRWTVYAAALGAVFLVYRASQYLASDSGAKTWGEGLSQALSSFPHGPPDSVGKGATAISQFALQMLLVLPVLHFARVQ